MTAARRRRVAITIGDANGIGPEIAVKAARAVQGEGFDVVLIGDAFVLEKEVALHAQPLRLVDFDDQAVVQPEGLPYIDVAALAPAAYQPGQLSQEAGAATIAYVRAAVALAKRGAVDAIVGCPHSETAIHRAGIRFSGYPGLIATLTNTPEDRVFLLLVAPMLKIGHVTLHEPLTQALARLTPELVVEAAISVVNATRALGIAEPRLGVFGINPHAGEGGLFGDADQRITEPAVARLKSLGLHVDGPLGADLLLSQRKHDVYLAMYHDQGHIPIKLISPLQASALSVGGGIYFSSVGHGCAFDIAGKGVADPTATLRTVRSLAGLEN